MEQTMQNIATTLASINAYLAVLTEDIENKKKKSDTKKEEDTQKRKRNIVYVKKKDGSLMLSESFSKNLTNEERGYYEGMMNNYPKVCMMPEPLTFEQFKKLLLRFPQREVMMTLAQLENYSKIKKYISAYKSLINWCQINEAKK